jgi:transcriptional regulator with XRE-family HTH domain
MINPQSERAAAGFARSLFASVKCGGYGYSQRDAARLLGVTQATLSRWASGRVPMPLWAALALSTIAGPLADPGEQWKRAASSLSFATSDARKALGPGGRHHNAGRRPRERL